MNSALVRPTAMCLVIAAIPAALVAQCNSQWISGRGTPGCDDVVRALVAWDPDAGGPEPERLVMAGKFRLSGDVIAASLSSWRPDTGSWAAFGTGLTAATGTADVRALLPMPDGSLVVAGTFASAGGQPASNVARFGGGVWSSLGAGTNGTIHSMALAANGDILVGGSFSQAGGQLRNGIARWDGSAWQSLGSPTTFTGAVIRAIATLPNGDVVVGGTWSASGGLSANIARWDGASWTPVDTGMNGTVEALAVDAAGSLYAGGWFTLAGAVPCHAVARWDGLAWWPVGGGVAGGLGVVHGLRALPGGLVVTGSFGFAGSTPVTNVAQWNGSTWTSLGSGIPGVVAAAAQLEGGDIAFGGAFASADGVVATNVVAWNGSNWRALGDGTDGPVLAIAELTDGRAVVGGDFRRLEGQVANGVAVHDGATWQALPGLLGAVSALAPRRDGGFWAAGQFQLGGSTAMHRVANWDGTAWTALGAGIPGPSTTTRVHALAQLPNGILVVGGSFSTAGATAAANIARWDGSSWQPLGAGCNGDVHCLAVAADGSLIVGGNFTTAGGVAATRIARWNGASWSAMGTGLPTLVTALLIASDGSIYANERRWNGAAWQPVASGITGQVTALAEAPDHRLLIAATSLAPVGVAGIVRRLDGGTWTQLGPTLDEAVSALRHVDGHGLLAGGRFTKVGASVSNKLARFVPGCPAAVAAAGNGCSGAPALTPVSWAFAGGQAIGHLQPVPPSSIALGIGGLAPANLSLPALLPFAEPGCMLWTDPLFVDVLAVASGAAEFRVPVAAASSVIGMAFYQQSLVIAIDPAGTPTSLVASNAIRFTVGSY